MLQIYMTVPAKSTLGRNRTGTRHEPSFRHASYRLDECGEGLHLTVKVLLIILRNHRGKEPGPYEGLGYSTALLDKLGDLSDLAP
jgi:hypothetical protein